MSYRPDTRTGHAHISVTFTADGRFTARLHSRPLGAKAGQVRENWVESGRMPQPPANPRAMALLIAALVGLRYPEAFVGSSAQLRALGVCTEE